jgi:hypothetical protein
MTASGSKLRRARRRAGLSGAAAVAALVAYAADVPTARGDPAYCFARAAAFMKELDTLLSKEKYSTTPFFELQRRYFPLVDCDLSPLMETASQSHFFRRTTFDERSQEFFVIFSSDDVEFNFFYSVKERRSSDSSVGFVNK